MSQEKTGRKQRKLRNIIINPSFQSKVIFLVVGIVAMQAIVISGYLYYSFDQFFQSSTAVIEGNSEVIEAVESLHAQLMMGMAVASLEFFIFAVLLSLFFSHRLAGPNYAIKRAINNLLDGVDHHKITLRRGDEFHDLAERINVLFSDYHLVPREKEEEFIEKEDIADAEE